MTADLSVKDVSGGVEFSAKVQPKARREGVVGTWGDSLKIAVRQPPERGRANAALCALIGRLLGVRKSDVTVVIGKQSSRKRIRVEGMDRKAFLKKISEKL